MSTANALAAMPQSDLYKNLCRFFADGRLPPSLLFTGRKGVGKWSVANALAKTITCLQPSACSEHGRADGYCDHCASCRQADSFSHPDIFYLFPLSQDEKKASESYLPYLTQKQQHPFSDASEDVKSFITIDSIRRFQNGLAHRPSLSSHKVGIIYEAERMLPATMDSLLKTLEEPPRHSYLIVVTDQSRFLLPTILSRLQRVNFPSLNADFVTTYLRQHYQVPEHDIGIITRFAAGTLYNLETLVERAFFEARESAFELFSNAVRMSAPDFAVKYSENAALDSRDKVERLLVHWQSFLRDLMIMHPLLESEATTVEAKLINFDYLDRYREFRQRFNHLESLEQQTDRLEQVRLELRRNVNPRMAALSFLLNLKPRQT